MFLEKISISIEVVRCHNLTITINGIQASEEDLAELERRSKLGEVQVFAKCQNGIINYRTI